MAGDIVVWILLGSVVFLVGRRFYRAMTDDTGGCGCTCSGCPQTDLDNQTCGIEAEQGTMVKVLNTGDPQDLHRES